MIQNIFYIVYVSFSLDCYYYLEHSLIRIMPVIDQRHDIRRIKISLLFSTIQTSLLDKVTCMFNRYSKETNLDLTEGTAFAYLREQRSFLIMNAMQYVLFIVWIQHSLVVVAY